MDHVSLWEAPIDCLSQKPMASSILFVRWSTDGQMNFAAMFHWFGSHMMLHQPILGVHHEQITLSTQPDFAFNISELQSCMTLLIDPKWKYCDVGLLYRSQLHCTAIRLTRCVAVYWPIWAHFQLHEMTVHLRRKRPLVKGNKCNTMRYSDTVSMACGWIRQHH